MSPAASASVVVEAAAFVRAAAEFAWLVCKAQFSLLRAQRVDKCIRRQCRERGRAVLNIEFGATLDTYYNRISICVVICAV